MMKLYPLFADLEARPVLVVGGGAVALRKCVTLNACRAELRVVATRLSSEFSAWITSHSIDVSIAAFDESALEDVWLVVAATNDRTLNRRIARAAQARRIFANVVDDSGLCSFHVPAVVDRSPLTIAISSAGTAPMLARLLRKQLEAALDQAWSKMAVLLAGRREAIMTRFRNMRQRRRIYQRLLDESIWRLLRTNRDEQALREVDTRLSQLDVPQTGCVSLVGAGPGDPCLLTLAALRCLHQADVILYDRLVDTRVLDMGRRDAQYICVGKRVGARRGSQRRIHRIMLQHARQGQHVVRLKGGDPFVFGRGGEELQFLRAHGIDYEVVPGITAAVACAAYAGIPLTHRDHAQSVRFLTGQARSQADALQAEAWSTHNQTLALYMGVARVAEIRSSLIANGCPRDMPVAMIENGTLIEQRVLLSNVEDMQCVAGKAQLRSPALLIIGRVAALSTDLAWFGSLPVQARLADAA